MFVLKKSREPGVNSYNALRNIKPKNPIPMPECKPPRIGSGIKGNIKALDLFKELLNNPRVESITINSSKVGSVEQTNINAKLKEDL